MLVKGAVYSYFLFYRCFIMKSMEDILSVIVNLQYKHICMNSVGYFDRIFCVSF